mmetsp:Transcript_8476/g.4610  ORF Transcript_8476/g.4610 Transcript_8476/m.4610 type:complete len:418 (-) Transcript_8476:3663-4916(-)
MFATDIKHVIEQISKEKGIDIDALIKAIQEALKTAAKKKFGSDVNIEVDYDEESGEVEVFNFKEVVKEVENPTIQISLAEGKLLDLECEEGDSLGLKINTAEFGRIATQAAKQVIIQILKNAERESIYLEFNERKGEIVNGLFNRFNRKDIIVSLGKTEAILPAREQFPNELYAVGDRIRAYLLDVRDTTSGPQILLSRTHPDFLINLFKIEVPEISEGIVTVVDAVREAGSRAKIAVSSTDPDVDPVGACVGMKGSRVQNVVQELKGEKIDIVLWHVEPVKFVCNALTPAEITRVVVDEENNLMEIIVPDNFLSIAIGKKGQNVRLASRLTGWRLNVKSETICNQTLKNDYNSLIAVPGVGIELADTLNKAGFFSVEDIINASVEDFINIEGISESKAEMLIEAATNSIEESKSET